MLPLGQRAFPIYSKIVSPKSISCRIFFFSRFRLKKYMHTRLALSGVYWQGLLNKWSNWSLATFLSSMVLNASKSNLLCILMDNLKFYHGPDSGAWFIHTASSISVDCRVESVFGLDLIFCHPQKIKLFIFEMVLLAHFW